MPIRVLNKEPNLALFGSFSIRVDRCDKTRSQLPVIDGKYLPLRAKNCFQKTNPCLNL
jgi:hypothetical protein